MPCGVTQMNLEHAWAASVCKGRVRLVPDVHWEQLPGGGPFSPREELGFYSVL